MKYSETEKIRNRIRRSSKGTFFILNDFLDISSREIAKVEMNRLVKSHTLRRVYNGIYQKPKINKLFDMEVPPTNEEILLQIARKNNQKIAPAGSTALNLVGISTQIPVKLEFITDGASRTIQFSSGPAADLKHSGKKKFFDSNEVNLLLGVLTYLNHDEVDEQVLKKLATRLDNKKYEELSVSAKKSTEKIRNYVHQIGAYLNA